MRAHPLNTHFVWQPPDPPFELITEDQARAYRETGGFVLADAFGATEIAELVAVYSSLTPHRTGPNLTESTRKAYILQYAPDGAVVHPRDGEPVPAIDPQWQFRITS